MNKAQKEQLKDKVAEITCLTVLLHLLMVIILFGMDIGSDTNQESQEGVVSYVTQLESLAGSKGYTTQDKVTYNERQQLETEDGRYLEVMKYLGEVEVSESEFQEIKDIQSKYQKSLKNVNESGKKDYGTLPNILIVIVYFVYMILLIMYALS